MNASLSALTLAALVAATLSTAAFADRKGPMGGMEGSMPFANFDQIDANKDGKLTPDELTAFRTARLTEADTNADGLLDAGELAAMHIARVTEMAPEFAARMIERRDDDKDGKLSVAELTPQQGPKEMFDRVDTDGDGAISKPEAEAVKARMAEHHGKGHGRGWFGHGGLSDN